MEPVTSFPVVSSRRNGARSVSIPQPSYRSPSETADSSDARCFPRIPIQVLPLALTVLSLAAVGAVSFVLTRANAEEALSRVGKSHRNLACTVVENEVLTDLSTLTRATSQLAEIISASNSTL
eukprot:RCo019529